MTKTRLGNISKILSGIYMKDSPIGDIPYLQVKDLLMASPEITASRIEYSAKLDSYMIQKGDLLFAGKGTTYLCEVYDRDFPAVPSTTLYSIRLNTDMVSPAYLRWYMNHPNVVAVIKSSQAGSATPLIHKPTLENLMILIPDQKTQQIIVEIDALQKREKEILESIADKKMQITNQLLYNELNK
ncbi:MAG: restriction endonuclease subunit S [Paludibacteraceae bacterium]|nr:restriction endonuclease subunit S [Paludibacteraceae bacterium]